VCYVTCMFCVQMARIDDTCNSKRGYTSGGDFPVTMFLPGGFPLLFPFDVWPEYLKYSEFFSEGWGCSTADVRRVLATFLGVSPDSVQLQWTTGGVITEVFEVVGWSLNSGRPYYVPGSSLPLLSPVVSTRVSLPRPSDKTLAAALGGISGHAATTRPSLALESNSWSDPSALTASGMPVHVTLSREQRLRLSLEWRRTAQAEHASVASFARHALTLLAVGAPARLLHAVQRAGDDEVRHAEICFAMAQAYHGRDTLGDGSTTGVSLAPAPFPFPAGPIELERSLAAIAAGCMSEGCCNETSAALILAAVVLHAV
jgi:hypothetical protein